MKLPIPLDLLIVIALEEEAQYVRSALAVPPVPEFVENRTLFRLQMSNRFQPTLNAAYIVIGDMGHEEAISEMDWWLRRLSAKVISNIGISGLADDNLALGDVVLATDADHFLYRSKITPKKGHLDTISLDDLMLGGKVFPTSSTFRQADTNLQHVDPQKWLAWLESSAERLKSIIPNNAEKMMKTGLIREKPKLVKGSIASSNIVGAHAAFKQFLKKHKNRNYLALDMESSAVLLTIDRNEADRPETLVLRGISDPADHRKSMLDACGFGSFRKLAILNAFEILCQIINATDFTLPRIGFSTGIPIQSRTMGAICGELHDIVLSRFIGRNYRKSLLESGTSFEDYATFFAFFSAPGPNITKDFFERLPSYISKVENLVVLTVEGQPGTGKSAFLSVCYWSLFQSRLSDPSHPIPFYINLHKYNTLVYDDSTSASTNVREAFFTDVEPLRVIASAFPESDLTIIIDGDDGFCKYRPLLQGLLRELLASLRHKKILGVRSEAEKFQNLQESGDDVSLFVRLQQRSLPGTDLNALIESFLRVASIDRTKQKADFIKQSLHKSKLSELDLFTLSMLSEAFDRGVASLPSSFSTIVEQFCEEFIALRIHSHGGMRQLVQKAATTAFDQQVGTAMSRPTHSSAREASILADLVELHPRIAEFLTAVHIVSKLERTVLSKRQSKGFPDYVFTYRINRYCKELINHGLDRQTEIVASLNQILKAQFLNPGQKANAAYLAGRLESPQAKASVKFALESSLASLEIQFAKLGKKADRQTMLFWRTVYISLAYMGDLNAANRYIDWLLNQPAWDNFNRGFHLEYYGDIPFTPSLPLQSDDDLRPCPNTFRQLTLRLASATPNALWEIELITLVSLAQHRHSTAQLSDNERASIRVCLIKAQLDQRLKHSELTQYVRMAVNLLSQDRFTPDSLFPKYFYRLKSVKRQGWIDRNLGDAESVCDHTIGAVGIAAFYLPDDVAGEPEYNKHKIISILLWHDLAEAIVGDVPTQKHSEETKQLEREVYEDIGMFGAIEGLHDLKFIRDCWRDFESSSINGRVAKDIDRLENLVQLWLYIKADKHIPDAKDWEDSLRRRVQTSVGKHLLNRLENTFEPKRLTQ